MSNTTHARPAPPTGSSSATACSVVVLDDLDSAAIHETLAKRMPRVKANPADTLTAALEQDGPVLVVVAAPEQTLAADLAECADATQAVARWTARQRDLLALQRRNRRRLTFVDATLLTRDGDDDWSVLARRLGGEAVEPGTPLTLAPPDAAQATFRLAAIALSLCNAEAASVIAELDAATLGRARGDATRSVLAAVEDWHNQRDEQGVLPEGLGTQPDTGNQAIAGGADERRVAASPAESQSLQKDDLALQLEAMEVKSRQHAQEIAAMRESHEAAMRDALRAAAQARQMAQIEKTAREGQAKLARDTMSRRDAVLGAQLLTEALSTSQLQAGLSRLEHDLEGARTELEQVQGALSQVTEARDRLNKQTETQTATIDALSQELDRVYGSVSWRVTGPLRAASSRLRSPRR